MCMTGDDLRQLQDDYLETSKGLLLERSRLPPVGLVVTLREHLDGLSKSGWCGEFIDLKKYLPVAGNTSVAALVVDLLMDSRRLYHAILAVFPDTRHVLPQMITLGEAIKVDDAHARVTSAFLHATGLNKKDVVTATMRQICGQVSAFACILCSEAWMRGIDSTDKAAIERANKQGIADDQEAFEVICSSMETYNLTRIIAVPVERQRTSTRRDEGKVTGFGKAFEGDKLEGRMAGLLKRLEDAA